jgi:hypothetical protein
MCSDCGTGSADSSVQLNYFQVLQDRTDFESEESARLMRTLIEKRIDRNKNVYQPA